MLSHEDINSLPYDPSAQWAPDKYVEVAAVHTDAKMSTIHEQNAFGILLTNYAHSGIVEIAGRACWLGARCNFFGLVYHTQYFNNNIAETEHGGYDT